MDTQHLPDGWEYEGWECTASGCLLIMVSYRQRVTYKVIWHTNDTVTCTGSDGSGSLFPTDPAPIAVAMAIAVEHGLTPRYQPQTGPWN